MCFVGHLFGGSRLLSPIIVFHTTLFRNQHHGVEHNSNKGSEKKKRVISRLTQTSARHLDMENVS